MSLKCSKCGHKMDEIGSRVTPDETVLHTTFMCACGHRVTRTAPNPRYAPAPKTVPVPPSKYRKPMPHVERDARPCCLRCGERIRSITADGMCGLCWEDSR